MFYLPCAFLKSQPAFLSCCQCTWHSRESVSLRKQHTLLLAYARIIGHCSLVGILCSNQSTTHCLHQQPEDCRRHISQYSLLRLKSYFSASTGYTVPKATICTSKADVSSTSSSGSPLAFRGHACLCMRVNTATHWASVLRTNERTTLRGQLYGHEQSSIDSYNEHAKKFEDEWNECRTLVWPDMNMYSVMWWHYNRDSLPHRHEWAVMWTAVLYKTGRRELSCQWCAARLMHKVPGSSI